MNRNYLLIVFFLLLIIIVSFVIFISLNLSPNRSSTQFALAATKSDTGKNIPSEKLGSSEYCGHCHTEVFQQWNASAHHFSSFNNPIYRKVALQTLEEKGVETLKFCAGCHDPLPLLSGELDDINKIDLNSWSAKCRNYLFILPSNYRSGCKQWRLHCKCSDITSLCHFRKYNATKST